jgi:hypothetical protein
MTLAALDVHLDAALREVWHDWAKGIISDAEAAERATLLEAQHKASRPIGRPLRAALPISKFTLRRCQRSPDREASRTRRRMFARDGRMPPGVRAHYTEGEAAALTIIAGEIKRHGCCDLPIDRIAAQAGVGRTTVQNAIREARRLGHLSKEERPVKGRKSLTNVIRVISREWLAWIDRGPPAGTGFKTLSTFNFVNPTKSKMLSEGRRREYG